MSKLNGVYMYYGILFNLSKEEILPHAKTQMNLMNMILNEITNEEQIFHDSILWMWYHSSSP